MNETKTIEQQNAEWNKDAFEGTEPFNDGATPEVLARIAKRADDAAAAHAENEARKQAAREKREQFKRREPLLVITRQLKTVKFNNEMLPAEMERTRKVLLDTRLVGKAARKGAAYAMLDYIRAHFCAGGGLHILVMKKCWPEEASEVFRIADMARVLFWKYRKPGCYGVDYTNEHLNYTTQRVGADIIENPHIVKLLEDYAKVLVDTGIFSDAPLEKGAALQKRSGRRYHTATVMKRADEMAEHISNLAAADCALTQRLTEHEAFFKAAQEVAAKKFETLDRWHNEVTTAQEVHKQNLITLNTEIHRVENEALARHAHAINALNAAQEANKSLGEKLVNVLNIALRLMSRVEVLEGVRLNTTTYFPPVPGEITTAPVQPNYQPIVTCDSQQKGVVRTAGVVG